MYYLNAIKDAGTDEPLKVAAKMREKPIGFLRPQRQAARDG